MSVKTSDPNAHAAQLIQCPPPRQPKPADPCAMVIFGASGDLTKRLVIPALYNLSRTKVLPEKFALIGVARTAGTSESWRRDLYGTLKSFVGNPLTEFDVDHIDEAAWKRLTERMSYIQGDLIKPALYDTLRHVSTRPRRSTAPRVTPSSISPSPIGSSAPWWTNSARLSCQIRTKTRTASAASGAAWWSKSLWP